MEATETDNDATPPLIEGEMSELAEIADSNLEDSDVQSPEDHGEFHDEPMRGEETESAREFVDAVIDHAGASTMTMDEDSDAAAASTMMDDETAPIEFARAADPDEEKKQAAMEEESNCDTAPMLEDDSGVSDARETPPEDGAIYGLADVKEEPIDEESSQPPPESSEGGETTGAGQFAASNLPATFPHCHVCGFDRETVFTREKKAPSGPHKHKIIYRNRCVRKACIRSFGPSYIWDAKAGEYVKIAEETSAASRPYALAPKEKKYPEIDYQRAGPSGVMPPVDNNGAWAKASRTASAVPTPPGGLSFDPAESLPSTSSAQDSPSSTRASASSASTPATKPPPRQRKGYAWVEEEVLPPRPDPVLELARMYEAQQRAEEDQLRAPAPMRTIGSQTGDEDHVVELLVDEMKKKAMFPALRPTDEVPITNANIQSLSNRMYLTQRTLKLQCKEIAALRAERDALARNQKQILEMFQDYRKHVVADITRLKEDVVVASKELRNFSLEMQNEAQKDIKDIKKLQVQVASRLDESDRYQKKVEAAMKFEKTKTEEAQFLSDKYHRKMVELEKKILVAKMEEEDAKEKLNDKIYLTNNAKCTHCQVNERIKNMLTEQIADKTLQTTNLSKERADLARRLENSEKIVAIVSKENKQLKFEKNAWEGTCHKLKAELMQLRGNTAGLVLPSSGEAAFTPQSVNKDADDVSPDGIGDEIMEILERPPASTSASSAEEGELRETDSPNTLARLPPPPPPPQPSQLRAPSPDHAAAFANWVPKDRKVQEPPPEYAEALRKVNESLERGPQPKEKTSGGPPSKKEKKDAAGAKRSGGPPFSTNSHHKNGEKKPKLEGGVKKEEKGLPSSRPIPTLGGPKKPPPPPPPPPRREKEIERREEMERRREPSPVPFSSTHEPAFPAVVAKKSVKVPYNGPSSLTIGNNSNNGGHSSGASTSKGSPQLPKKQPVEEKKKPMCFLPVAGSLAIPPSGSSLNSRDQSSLPALPMDANALLREAERLRAIERQRQRHDQPRDSYAFDPAAADRRASMQPMMGGGGGAPPPSSSRFDFTDDDLPWNAARGPGFNEQQQQHMGGRPRTPTQDWYFDEPRGGGGGGPGGGGGLAPPPMQQPRAPSPGQRYFDDMYNPRLPRRIEPEFVPRFHHPGITPAPPQMRASPPLFQHPAQPPHSLLRGAPPPGFQAPPPGQHHQNLGLPPHLQQAPPGPHDAWRRGQPDPNWNGGEPPRRNYWD